MPDISKLTMSNGVVYNIKDSQARKDIEDMKKNGSGSGVVLLAELLCMQRLVPRMEVPHGLATKLLKN